jgi:hypothetical protein
MFLDGARRNLGWAVRVVKRKPSPGGLTTLDVTTSDAALTTSLLMLDKHRLFVMSEGESFAFAWASGYQNGSAIRIQGVLAAG